MPDLELIRIDEREMPKRESDALDLWMMKSEFTSLRKIAESKAKKSAVAASNKVAASAKYPSYIEAASAELDDARKYQTFLLVLDEIKNESPHKIVSVS